MVQRLQKSVVISVAGLSLMLLLTACSRDSRYKREISGNEDYLKSAEMKDLVVPAGMILPIENGTYTLPAPVHTGVVGKALDIRPPAQPLDVVSGSRSQYTGGTSTALLENTSQNSDLWSQLIRVMDKKGYRVADRQDASQTLNTDWVNWSRLDENQPVEARYQITLQPQGYQTALLTKVIELRQNGSTLSEPTQIQRYTVLMQNEITTALDSLQNSLASGQSTSANTRMDVTADRDSGGLPLMSIRAPYNTVWDRMPDAMRKIGMSATERNQPQGSMQVKYSPLSASGWRALGLTNPGLSSGEYKLQLGDLGNRTTLQVTDKNGRPVSDAQNEALVKVFQTAFDIQAN